MVPDQSKETITTKTAPKGLAAMFGGSMPSKYQSPTNIKNSFTATSMTNNDDPGQGGGSWKSVSKRKGGMSLASRARLQGKEVTITASRRKTHMDDDQDIAMGESGKKKAKRYSPYIGKKPKVKAPIEQRVDVLIQGFEPGTEAGVIQFLQIKSKKDWQPLDCKVEGGDMLLTVNGNIIAGILTRLDGYMLGTQQLHIRLYNTDTAAATPLSTSNDNKKQTTMDILRTFLKSRWNSSMGYLNLEAMYADPILKKNGIRPPGANGASPVVGPALMKLASEMFQNDVITLSFANNRLHNVQSISTVSQYLPHVQNLSLQGNSIKAFEGLEALSGTGKLPHLRELVMGGNPIVESEIKKYGNDRGYLRNMVKRFPSLVLLDGQPVNLSEEETQSILKTGKVLPLDTKHNLFDSEETRLIAMPFVMNYFTTFDASPSQRGALKAIYAPQATFSISTLLRLRSHNKIRRKEKKKLMTDDDNLEWTSLNRNLKLQKQKQGTKGLVIGQEAIGETLQRLPPTIHDFNNTKDFVMDAHQTIAGLVLTIHGEFKEDEKATPYSFDRTFTLQPSSPDSSAAIAGSALTIVADMFTIRDYIGNQGFQPHLHQSGQSVFASMPSLPTVPI
ncbi:uncharacterized protein BX664DRAFT_335979 [Halteromyces radiatus]|uniref:uncharacterized protein n=1 Tax=Halteromyces radiatus TaxID=101107 RepID=UPI00222031EE|nr:uncharacterized protein BX664DRAFT_335979 [Halteromyces radiatus]KAI8086503.1 hypothetical protein BX664DRAFT_335979 [Halteromyces radiatus]